MAWTDSDLKIFAAGLAIGGKYNHTLGTLPRVKSSVVSGTYWYTQYFTLSCDLTEATILYSVDGSTPTTVYAGEEIYIGESLVCYAYAVYGQGLSPMSKFIYIVDNPLANLSDTVTDSGVGFGYSDIVEISVSTVSIELTDTVDLDVTTTTDTVITVVT